MLRGLFGPNSVSAMLRGGLEEASATHRRISQRVAGTLASSSSTSFEGALQSSEAVQARTEANLQRDMAELADTQLRYEADAKLLQQAYARLLTAIRNHV